MFLKIGEHRDLKFWTISEMDDEQGEEKTKQQQKMVLYGRK